MARTGPEMMADDHRVATGNCLPLEGRLPDLRDFSVEELAAFLAALGEKPFRVRQIVKWLYRTGSNRSEDMTDLSRNLRERLNNVARISAATCLRTDQAADGTVKFLWSLDDGARIESVLIPEREHYTLCLSSQVGCAMGCRFCRTAGLGWRRHLTQAEIINQFLGAKASLPQGSQLTNLVFMGMGEPLANLDHVLRALRILTDPGLIGLSRRHLSVSTVGLVNELTRLAEAVTIGLTV
ncbi:MAG: radical SAM protein, partial [Deltaproteobacteria bacterium]|nr:radical SAM protein [Deltaproteobacteria bacterium]